MLLKNVNMKNKLEVAENSATFLIRCEIQLIEITQLFAKIILDEIEK